jgi:hypothetical protein
LNFTDNSYVCLNEISPNLSVDKKLEQTAVLQREIILGLELSLLIPEVFCFHEPNFKNTRIQEYNSEAFTVKIC